MMKKYIVPFLFVFGLLFVFSCEPSRAENGDFLFGVQNPGETGGNGNTTITKILKTVTAKNDNGDLVTQTYNYVDKKLTSVTTSDNSYDFQITYNGNNITKIVKNFVDNGNPGYYTYNMVYTANKITKMNYSIVSQGEHHDLGFIDYTYNSSGKVSRGIITAYGLDDQGNTITNLSLEQKFTYNGDNVAVFYSKLYGGLFPDVITTVNFTAYDSKVNPYNTLPEQYRFASILIDEGVSVNGLSSNNFTKSNSDVMGTTFNINPAYTYDVDNYPTKQNIEGENTTFTYVKL